MSGSDSQGSSYEGDPPIYASDSEPSDTESEDVKNLTSLEAFGWSSKPLMPKANKKVRAPSKDANKLFGHADVEALTAIDTGSGSFSTGDCLQIIGTTLSGETSPHNDYFQIRSILRDRRNGDLSLRGYRLHCVRNTGGIFRDDTNELVLRLLVQADSPQDQLIQGLEELSFDDALERRANILFTQDDKAIEECLVRNYHGTRSGEDSGFWLLCTHMIIMESSKLDAGGVARRISKRAIDMLTSSPLGRKQVASKRALSRGDDRVQVNSLRRPWVVDMQYTLMDAFCGAGGVSRSAVMAGLKPTLAFDIDPVAVRTYLQNFPKVECYERDVADFGDLDIKFDGDIIHFSASCKFFSRAHVKDGPNDVANIATSTVFYHILVKYKPRLATLEQTDGLITQRKHTAFFGSVVNQFIEAGYTIRWQIINALCHRVAQKRKRLFMLAARRGIPLPPFPRPTNGHEGSGLKPHITIYKALKPTREDSFSDPRHQPKNLKPLPRQRPRYNPRERYFNTITCNGGDNYYSSGQRSYTIVEFMLGQGFPLEHIFSPKRTKALEQIGNSVSPPLGKAIFAMCVKTLEAFDAGLLDAEDDTSIVNCFFEDNGQLKADFVPPEHLRKRLWKTDEQSETPPKKACKPEANGKEHAGYTNTHSGTIMSQRPQSSTQWDTVALNNDDDDDPDGLYGL